MAVCRGRGMVGGTAYGAINGGSPFGLSVRPWCNEVTSGWKSWIRDVHTARTGVPRVKPSVPGVCSFSVGSFMVQSYDRIASNLLTGVLDSNFRGTSWLLKEKRIESYVHTLLLKISIKKMSRLLFSSTMTYTLVWSVILYFAWSTLTL